MNGPEALQHAWAELAGTPGSSLAELVSQLGGTRHAAAALDVTQRSIERYMDREARGKTKYNRQISATQRTLLADAVTRKQTRDALKQIGQRGLGGQAPARIRISQSVVNRIVYTATGPVDLADMDGPAMEDAILGGDWDDAWDMFKGPFLEAYGTGQETEFEDDEVDDLELWYGDS